MTESINLPRDSWDCHMHCFDPIRFPFSPSRVYTPTAAPLESLVEQSLAQNIVLVQASVEDGSQGLLSHLAQCQTRFSQLTVRGTICNDKTNLQELRPQEFERLHTLGVRSVRIHGSYSTDGHDVALIETQIRALARSAGIRKHRWSISAQIPLQTWASLEHLILYAEDIAHVIFIADHSGCATPRDVETPALDSFVRLLKTGRLYVKLGALHRRSPGDVQAMKPIVQRFVGEAPHSLLWGSDWPHVDSSQKGLETSKPHPGANTTSELQSLRSWLTTEQWKQMLVDNPRRVFGNDR